MHLLSPIDHEYNAHWMTVAPIHTEQTYVANVRMYTYGTAHSYLVDDGVRFVVSWYK